MPAMLCSYSLMLCAGQRGSKYLYYSLRFDSVRAQTHDLPPGGECANYMYYTTDEVIVILYLTDFYIAANKSC